MKEYISFWEARSIVLGEAKEQPAEVIPLSESLYRTLAEEVVSSEFIPPFNNSAMDGYALRADDLKTVPATLKIIEDIPAGFIPKKTVDCGECASIMTGAPMPRGADTVVPTECTENVSEETVRIVQSHQAGKNVRFKGQDVEKGRRVIDRGRIIIPPVLGILATLGYAKVSVRKKPRVAVITTGDELVDVLDTPTLGQIRDSNGPALGAQVAAAGGETVLLLRAGDRMESISETIHQAKAADILVFSGGVSVGACDYVKQVLEEAGMDLLFWRVRQRPGKPLAFGKLGHRLVFGLPGNPVSAAVNFEQYVRPTIAKMLGRSKILPPLHNAVLEGTTGKVKGIHFFVRGIAFFDNNGYLRVRETGLQSSNIYSSVLQANCIVHLPESLEKADDGTPVKIEYLQW